jgi:hypothetical protein
MKECGTKMPEGCVERSHFGEAWTFPYFRYDDYFPVLLFIDVLYPNHIALFAKLVLPAV